MESELGTATAGGTDTTAILGTARDKIAAFLDDMVTATDKAAAGIKSAGSPSSPNGGKIATVFVNGFKAISKEFKSAEAQAKQLPTTSAADFQSKGTELGQTISDSANELSKGFSSVDKLDKGKKLETAVKAAPACAFLTDSSSSS